MLFGKTLRYKQSSVNVYHIFTWQKPWHDIMDNATFKDVPELFEVSIFPVDFMDQLTSQTQVELGEAITARTESLCK